MKTVYFTCAEVAEMTGLNVRAVWRLCQGGHLKYTSPNGRNYLIEKKDLDEFLESPIGVLRLKGAKRGAGQDAECRASAENHV